MVCSVQGSFVNSDPNLQNLTNRGVNNIKVVLFDHDDTLVSTIKSKWAQHKYIAKKFYGKHLKDEDIRTHWGKPLSMLVKLLYQTENIDMAMSYNIATREQFPKTLFDDTISTLEMLNKNGFKLGVITATTRSSLEHDFKTLRIPQHIFHYIQTEDDTKFFKPDARVFEPAQQWLAQHQIQSDEVIYVGDALTDLQAAQGAGFHFIGVTTGLFSSENFKKEGVPFIQRLSELLFLSKMDR